MAQAATPLRIICQPKETQRERYISEMRRNHHRTQRFIRAVSSSKRGEYPTIEIPQCWNGRRIYIRVTLVTVPSTEAPAICVHPYPINTSDLDVIRDVDRNTLFFPVTNLEFKSGQKSFRITRNKLIQHELQNYGQLRLLDKDERDIRRTTHLNDARQLINVYQLGNSQLLFSIAELIDDRLLPVIYTATSVYSNTMMGSTATSTSSDDDTLCVRYAPQKGDWQGGDTILMVIPRLDRRRDTELYFEYNSMQSNETIPVEYIDSKTISFVTPACPLSANGNQTIEVPIVVKQNNEEIGRINFLYQSIDRCSTCERTSMLDTFDESNTCDQSSTVDTYLDDGDHFMYEDSPCSYMNY